MLLSSGVGAGELVVASAAARPGFRVTPVVKEKQLDRAVAVHTCPGYLQLDRPEASQYDCDSLFSPCCTKLVRILGRWLR